MCGHRREGAGQGKLPGRARLGTVGSGRRHPNTAVVPRRSGLLASSKSREAFSDRPLVCLKQPPHPKALDCHKSPPSVSNSGQAGPDETAPQEGHDRPAPPPLGQSTCPDPPARAAPLRGPGGVARLPRPRLPAHKTTFREPAPGLPASATTPSGAGWVRLRPESPEGRTLKRARSNWVQGQAARGPRTRD